MASRRTPPPTFANIVRSIAQALIQLRTEPLRSDPALKEEVRIALASRRELGADYDQELVDHFVTRVNQAIERRVEELWQERERQRRRIVLGRGVVLTLVLLAAIPLTFVAGLTAGVQGIAVVWFGLLLIVIVTGILWRA